MGSIKVLPESVHSSMRSSVILFDFTRVVEELVFNSLDAGATKVNVAVGVAANYIKVTDNGCGISREGLVLLGGRYATSKIELLTDMDTVSESFGFRGEALCSISDVALLELVTKTHGMPNGYRKVIKSRKCLYLGIDDERQDVGTTVVVRDLFYNQPVRRRHLQSSPKKVLHSVKECLMKIALVHLRISFKMIDTESGDELLCVYPSSSPLPLLTSGFGTEVSSSLHELDACDGELKLSGYISGPSETFSVKAFQFFYINSRFISKGPVHKMLNQLSTMHSCSDLLKVETGSQCGKRSRSQEYPTYILNFSCPRAHYDLYFESSTTSVAFKDWDHVLAFIQKVISRFWSQNIRYEISHGADISQKDTWAGADTLSTKDDLLNNYGLPTKRRMMPRHQNSLGISSTQREMLSEKPKHITVKSNNTYSSDTPERKAVHFEEPGSSMDFDNRTDYSLTSSDRSLHRCKSPILQDSGKHLGVPKLFENDMGVPNRIISSEEDTCFLNKFNTELSSGNMDHMSGTNWNTKPTGTDCNTSKRLLARKPYTDHFVDDLEKVDASLTKPFLRNCSSHMRKVPVVGSRGDEKSISQADEFRKWLYRDDKVDNGEADDIIYGSDLCPNKVATVWSPPRIISTCKFGSNSSLLSGESLDPLPICNVGFNEEDSRWADPVASILDSNSSHLPSRVDWSALALESAFVIDDVFEKHSKEHRDDGFDDSEDEEGKDDIFNIDNKRYNSPQEGCALSSYMIRSPSHKDHASYERDTRKFSNRSVLFREHDFLDETEWGHFDSFGENVAGIPVAASHHMSSFSYNTRGLDKRARIRFENKKKSRRSCSAPPSFRGKKKFVALNSWMPVKPGKSCIETIPNATALQEASNLKHKQKSSGVEQLELKEGLTKESKSMARCTQKTIYKAGSNCRMKEDQCLGIYNTNSDLSSKENQGALDFGEKWRNGCPWTASREKPQDLDDQDSILDISSRFLHLSGDSLVPKSISKKCLEDCRVLQQVDKKFIPVVARGILAVIDQHAADERIRLEDLRQKVLSGEMKAISYLDAEQELVLPEIGYQLLHNYSEQIQKWGWICNFHAQISTSFKRNLNFLHNQPSLATLIAVPSILGVNLTDLDLLEFLQQLSDTDGSSLIPPAVLRVLNFKACRGAIMFGDQLLPSECSLIVEELKQTSLCFQCAHGRPTTAPLVDLAVLRKQMAKLGNCKHGSAEQWHGLSRHRPSLNRAAQRLNSEGGQC